MNGCWKDMCYIPSSGKGCAFFFRKKRHLTRSLSPMMGFMYGGTLENMQPTVFCSIWQAALAIVPAMGSKKGGKGCKCSSNLPEMDISGLSEEWDGCEDIRTRLRDGLPLIHPEATRDDVQGCARNASLLIPLLTRMASLESKALPPVDDLRGEIEKVLHRNKRGNGLEEADLIIKSSWRVKKLCGFVKMKARREEVSSVTCLRRILFVIIHTDAQTTCAALVHV